VNPIEIKVKRSYYIRLIFTALFTLGIGAILMFMEYRRWGRTFDGTGVMRQDGNQLFWADLQKKVFIHRALPGSSNGPLNHIELLFSDGKALVFPLMLENAEEVMTFVEQLSAQKENLTIH
jgi:hypothetical protein